jgi:uncharacterized membrane protein YfcA
VGAGTEPYTDAQFEAVARLARRLGTPALRRALAVVLVIAGLKLIFLG